MEGPQCENSSVLGVSTADTLVMHRHSGRSLGDHWTGTGMRPLIPLISPMHQENFDLSFSDVREQTFNESFQCNAQTGGQSMDVQSGDHYQKLCGSLVLLHQIFSFFGSLFWESDSRTWYFYDYSIAFATVILTDTFNHQIDLGPFTGRWGSSLVEWFSDLPRGPHFSTADLLRDLREVLILEFKSRWRMAYLDMKNLLDLDLRMLEWCGAVLLSWIIAIMLFGIGCALTVIKRNLLFWWHYCPGPCRRAGPMRIPNRKQKTPSWNPKGLFFTVLLITAQAEETVQSSWNIADHALRNVSGIHAGVSWSQNLMNAAICEKGGTSVHEGLTILDRQLFIIHNEFWLSFRLSTEFGVLYVLGRDATESSHLTQAADFCLADCLQRCETRSVSPFECTSAAAPRSCAQNTEIPVEPTADLSRHGHELTSDMTSLMQLGIREPGETCGQHTDPIVYWDRLSYRPPIITGRFFAWQTDVTRTAQLQRRLISVTWDGRSCVSCAFAAIMQGDTPPMYQGPYYIRPQPPSVDGTPALQFIVLETPKLSMQRVAHVSLHTRTGQQRGTVVFNTITGTISVQFVFDTLVPTHACRTTSWCRARLQTPTGYQIWWWPTSFPLSDFSHVDLDEFDISDLRVNVPGEIPSSHMMSCQRPNPDPGGTAYQEDDGHSLLTTSTDVHTELDRGDDSALMHMPSRAASRSRSDSEYWEDDQMEGQEAATSDDSSTTSESDALVVYSRNDEAVLIPIGLNVDPDRYRVLVAEHLNIPRDSDDWQAITVHPVRPKPPDLANCVIPLIMIPNGQHALDKVFILLDLELHSNEIDECGEKQEPYTLRETWTISPTMTRSAFLHWIGVTNLCRNRAYPCLVEIGDHPWLQQDTRPHTLLDGLFVRVVINIPNPKFSLTLYLHYARQGVQWLEMEAHWRGQLELSARRLRNMFGDDDNEELLGAALDAEQVVETDDTDLITTRTWIGQQHPDNGDAFSLMGRLPLLADRQRSPRSSRDEMFLYEWHARPHSTTMDPSLTRKEYRETIGAIMDIPRPSRLWDNFEFHQVRPLPSDHDPLNVVAFIFVHPTTIIPGLVFVLVQISVTYETAVCGRFETAIDRAVHRVPASLVRETFLTNIKIWDLCVVSGNDQCEVRLPDRLWMTDDLENRILFDGAYLQVKCTTPYRDTPVQLQLRASLEGMSYQTMIRTNFRGDVIGNDVLGLLQTSMHQIRRRGNPNMPPFREATDGLPPPGNTLFFNIADDNLGEEDIEPCPAEPVPIHLHCLLEETGRTDGSPDPNRSIDLETLDQVYQTVNGNYALRDIPKTEIRRICLSDLLQIPRPLRPDARCHEVQTTNDIHQEPVTPLQPWVSKSQNANTLQESAVLTGHVDLHTSFDPEDEFWIFNPERDIPQSHWKNLHLPQEITDFLSTMPPTDFASDMPGPYQEFAIYTDGTFDGQNAAWAVAIFVHRDSWQFVGYLADKAQAEKGITPSALLGEQTAIFAATWWVLTYAHGVSWKGKTTFYWDCRVAGKKAQGEFALRPSTIDQHIRHIQQALTTWMHPDQPEHQHVKAHTGVLPNELADAISKEANHSKFQPDLASSHISDILKLKDLDFEWLWVHFGHTDSKDLPTFRDKQWHWELGTNSSIDVDKAIRTTFLGIKTPTDTQKWNFDLQVGSYNCMTLGGDDVEHYTSFMSKATLLRTQADAMGYHLLGLQETRSPAGLVQSATHLRFSSGCTPEHTHGVELWVALRLPFGWNSAGTPCFFRRDSFAVIDADPRILVVTYQSPELNLHCVVAHAPHQGTETEHLELWWKNLNHRIQKYPRNEVIIFVDANQRITQPAEPHIGDLIESHKPQREDLLLDCLVTNELTAPATWSEWQRGPIYTWTHPGTHSRSRIDYLFVPLAWTTCQITTWVDDYMHAGHAALDHQCTAMRLRWTALARGDKRGPSGFDKDRMACEEAKPVLEHILAMAPMIGWDVHATDHASTLTDYLQNQLAIHFPQKKTMRHWKKASDQSLAVYHQLTTAKRTIRTLDKMVQGIWMRLAFDSWTGRNWIEDNYAWTKKILHKLALERKSLPNLAKTLTRQVRSDKRAYADSVASQTQTCSPNEIFRALKPLMSSSRKSTSCLKPLPQIEKLDGGLTTSTEEYADRWVQHFSDIESGHLIEPSQYFTSAAALQATQCYPTTWCPEDLPKLNDLERAIRRSGWRKATGPDGIPNEVFKANPSLAARLLFPMACKFAIRLQEPLQYKGGQIIALSKGRGSAKQCTSFRGILLLSTAGKLIRASLRQRINEPYQTQTDAFQLAGKSHQQVLFGAQGIRSFIRWQKAENRPSAVLFCDVASAFYMTLRQIAVGASTSDQDIARIAAHFGLSPDVMPQLHAALNGDTSYSQIGATAAQQALLRESLRSTWFSWDQSRFVETTRGTRPGDSWADVVFNIMFHQVLLQIKDRLRSQGLLLEIAPPESRTPWPGCPRSQHLIPAFHTTWADDLAIMLTFESADSAQGSLCHATAHLLDALRAFGMRATIGDGKTEAMLWIRGAGAVRLRQHTFGQAKPSLTVLQEDEAINLPLTARYKHLGGILSSSCTMVPELKTRGQKALRTYWSLCKPIFRSQCIDFDAKLRIFSATVLAILTWGSGAWPLLNGQEFNLYQRQTWDLYRRIAQIKLKSRTPSRLTHAEILEATGFAHPQDLLDESRARYLGSLVLHGPDQLWALLHYDSGALEAYQQALRWLWEAIRRDSILGDPQHTWEEWSQLISAKPATWKTLIHRAAIRYRGLRRRNGQTQQWHQHIAQILVDHGRTTMPTPPTEKHWCLVCMRSFAQKRAWFLHAHHKHGYRSIAGSVVQGRHCPRCDRVYKDSTRLLHHLQYSRACRQLFWHLKHHALDTSCTVEDSHPQCPWMPFATDFVMPDYDQTDPDLLHLQQDFQQALPTFIQPDDDQVFVTKLVEHLQHICTQVFPYDLICAAFTDWAERYKDSMDGRLLIAIETVGLWLSHPNTLPVAPVPSAPKLEELEIHQMASPTRNWRCTEVLFLHLYSGRRREGDLQDIFETMTWPSGATVTVISVDVAVDALKCDLSQPSTRLRWLQILELGGVSGLGAGPPCETWSVARFTEVDTLKHSPRPVRLRDQPWGLLDLTGREATQVSLGNLLMGFAIVASLIHALRGNFLFLEHPADAYMLGFGPAEAPSVWATSLMQQIMKTGCFCQLTVSQGYFGAKSAKPTTLLLAGVDHADAKELEKTSRTSTLPKTRSVGRVNGEWATSGLKEYPPNFNRFLGLLFGNWLEKQTDLAQRPLAHEHTWILELYRALQEAPTKAGPAPDFHKGLPHVIRWIQMRCAAPWRICAPVEWMNEWLQSNCRKTKVVKHQNKRVCGHAQHRLHFYTGKCLCIYL